MNWYCNIYKRIEDNNEFPVLLIYNDIELDTIMFEIGDVLLNKKTSIDIDPIGIAIDMRKLIQDISKYSENKYKDIFNKLRLLIYVDHHTLYHTLIPESYKIEIENFNQIMFKPENNNEKEIIEDDLTIENKILVLTLFDKCIEYKINEKK